MDALSVDLPLQQLDAAAPLDESTATPPEAAGQTASPVTLFVCTTCKSAGAEAEAPPGGQALYEAALAGNDGAVAVRDVRCLANCKRGLSAALVRDGGWSYVFGDLTPASAGDLLAGGRLFRDAADGLMPWRGRPDALKRGMVARIPPLSLPPSA